MIKTWTTRDGTKVRINDMTDHHVINTIRMLERNAERATSAAIADGYAVLGMVQGEMAELYIEQDLNSLEEDGICPSEISPAYEALVEEAARRKISW